MRFYAAGFVVLCAGIALQLVTACSAESDFDLSHSALNDLLARHVRDGRVDYVGLQTDRSVLQSYLQSLGRLSAKKFEQLEPEHRLALLINAYNAFTLELILQNYPVASIRDIPMAWERRQWRLFGKTVSLNQIEHAWIRAGYAEPRIHFAIVCASLGCPPLRAEAYRGTQLLVQLADACRTSLQKPGLMRLDTERGILYVSKIFEWFADDFIVAWGESELPAGSPTEPAQRAIVGFVRMYAPADEAVYLAAKPVEIRYLEYDWSLNDYQDH